MPSIKEPIKTCVAFHIFLRNWNYPIRVLGYALEALLTKDIPWCFSILWSCSSWHESNVHIMSIDWEGCSSFLYLMSAFGQKSLTVRRLHDFWFVEQWKSLNLCYLIILLVFTPNKFLTTHKIEIYEHHSHSSWINVKKCYWTLI